MQCLMKVLRKSETAAFISSKNCGVCFALINWKKIVKIFFFSEFDSKET